MTAGLDLSAGLELQREQVTSTYITDDNGPIPVKRRVAGYFGEARWSPSERIFVTGGLRLEDIERDAVGALNDAFSPRPAMPAQIPTSRRNISLTGILRPRITVQGPVARVTTRNASPA